MDYVFAFDVSQDAVRSGFLQTACVVLTEVLYGREDGTVAPCFPPASRIAIVAYDRTLQFYNLSVRLCSSSALINSLTQPSQAPVDGQPPLLVVPDVDEVFLPVADGLFVNPLESRCVTTRNRF